MSAIVKVVLVPLCVAALVGCATPSGSTSANGMPHVNRASVAAPVMERFRPEVGEYLAEIQHDNDYANWRVPPSTAFNQ